MSALIPDTSGEGVTYTVGGVHVYVDDQGSGDAVVLLHGGLLDHQSWGHQIPALSKHFRVLSPDTRAHGRSSDTDEPFTYQRFADDAVALMAALDLPRVSLVGFSDGGATALLVAMQHPELVDKLVLLGTPYNVANYPPGTTDAFAALTPESYAAATDQGSAVAEGVRKADRFFVDDVERRRFWRKLANTLWVHEPDLDLSELASVTAPTLILHGENEEWVSWEASEAMAAAMPDARLVVVAGASHMSAQENPEAVNVAILDFLRGRDRRAS